MNREQFNLDREFIKWFYEEAYPEVGSNRSQVMASGMPIASVDVRDYWMRLAFKRGAEAMWNDVNETLLAYACAVEGLDPEMVTPAEIFDRARENLHSYVNTQLELFP
jgi:hypothetical protein